MSAASHLLAATALIACAVIYGTDVFAATVLRPALARVDDATLTRTMGYVHEYADRRLPVPGVVGLLATIAAASTSAIAGRDAATAVGVAVAASLVVWLVIYRRISAPVNHRLTVAAHASSTPADARMLQRRWDSVINARVALQALALAGLCVTLLLP